MRPFFVFAILKFPKSRNENFEDEKEDEVKRSGAI